MSREILVVGTGSIGRRHIDNLVRLGVHVSAFRYRCGGDPLPHGVSVVTDIERALSSKVDAVVVANRSDQHVDVALRAAANSKALFIEKPIGTTLAGVNELARRSAELGLVVEVGLMLRTHPNLVWICDALARGVIGEMRYARAIVGQLLTDWRPGSDHRDGYGAKRASGGGVIFDLVHELDLIEWLLGEVTDVTAMTAHVDTLEIETEAIAQIGLRLSSGVLAQVHLDYVRPGYERRLEIVGSRAVLSWDYLAGTVSLAELGKPALVAHRVSERFERNDMFLAHMQHFLDRIDGRTDVPIAPLDAGIASLRVALAAHRSAETRQVIRPREIPSDYTVNGSNRA